MTAEFNKALYEAKLAEQMERYQEMVECMKRVLQHLTEAPTLEMRNLLSVAYKNVIGNRRSAWRVIQSIEERQSKSDPDPAKLNIIQAFRRNIESELDEITADVLNVIEHNLLVRKDLALDEKVFYYKMKGDYCRYQAEYMSGEKRESVVEAALEAYQTAEKFADGTDGETALKNVDPIRIGLALNYSVLHYEIRKNPKEACKLAKAAFDGAIEHIDDLPEDTYKDSALIMGLLRDNLTLWTSELQDEPTEDKDQ